MKYIDVYWTYVSDFFSKQPECSSAQHISCKNNLPVTLCILGNFSCFYLWVSRAQIQKVFSEGVQFWLCLFLFLFSWWGQRGSKYHYKRPTIGPPAKHHLNSVSLAGRWWPNIECRHGSFVVVQGIWTSIAKKSYIFFYFSGGLDPLSPPPPPPPSGSVHV